jgi:hypothetical protein
MTDGEVDQSASDQPTPAPPVPKRKPEASEVIGRGLGLAFKRLKKTRAYQRNVEAYHEVMDKD